MSLACCYRSCPCAVDLTQQLLRVALMIAVECDHGAQFPAGGADIARLQQAFRQIEMCFFEEGESPSAIVRLSSVIPA